MNVSVPGPLHLQVLNAFTRFLFSDRKFKKKKQNQYLNSKSGYRMHHDVYIVMAHVQKIK